MFSQARQGVTALRTVLKGWELQHGPGRFFSDADCSLLPSLEFCAAGIEALLGRMSERLDDAVEAGDTVVRRPPD
jgi:hypothetical protein